MKNFTTRDTAFLHLVGFLWVQRGINLKHMACLVLSGLASLVIAVDTQWPINAQVLMRDELIAVTLPTSLFANGQADATTLRVHDEQGGEIPVLYESLQTVAHVRERVYTLPFKMVAAEMPDGALRLTLRRAISTTAPNLAASILEGVEVKTPIRDFEQQVRVEGSDDGVIWTTLVEQASIFDFSRHANVRRTEITFPSGISNEYLRLTFEQAVDAREQLTSLITSTQSEEGGLTQSRAVQVDTRPLLVESVNGWTTSLVQSSRKPVRINYPVAWTSQTNGVSRGKTRYAIEATGQPLTQLVLAIPADYASWPYTLSVDSPTATPTLARGVLKQFRFRCTTDSATTIVFPETRAQRFLLTFDHPKAEVTNIQASGPRYRVIFPARPEQRYTLIQLQEPSTGMPDTTQIVALLARDIQPVEGTLFAIPQPMAAQSHGTNWLRHHLLPIGIGVALLALTLSLSRAMRRL